MKSVNTYSALALVYDVVMDHVDYEGWADYILHILESHSTKDDSPAFNILELGCGTGLFTEELLEQTQARISAADSSVSMLEWAGNRLHADTNRVSLFQLNFETGWDECEVTGVFDAILLLYDCINYIHTPLGLDQLFSGVKDRMDSGSVFIFDQSTPANSINNAAYFEDDGEINGVAYTRKSAFDTSTRIHTTQFEIQTTDGTFLENHIQRAWTKAEIQQALDQAGLQVIASYDGFSLDPSIDESERIHWVVVKPETIPTSLV